MKLETLVKRYKNLGYEPNDLERDLEVQCIIKWLYEVHDYHVYALLLNMKVGTPKHVKEMYLKFSGQFRPSCHQDYSQSFSSGKYFKSPFDAEFDAVRHLLSSLRFIRYDWNNKIREEYVN